MSDTMKSKPGASAAEYPKVDLVVHQENSHHSIGCLCSTFTPMALSQVKKSGCRNEVIWAIEGFCHLGSLRFSTAVSAFWKYSPPWKYGSSMCTGWIYCYIWPVVMRNHVGRQHCSSSTDSFVMISAAMKKAYLSSQVLDRLANETPRSAHLRLPGTVFRCSFQPWQQFYPETLAVKTNQRTYERSPRKRTGSVTHHVLLPVWALPPHILQPRRAQGTPGKPARHLERPHGAEDVRLQRLVRTPQYRYLADSAPQDCVITATLWPMCGAWLCTHIWSHFEYTGDVTFLQRMYPILKGSVEFFLDFLINRAGYKVTSPSLSPEKRYRLPNGEESTMCISPTMDSQILFRLFTNFLSASTILTSTKPPLPPPLSTTPYSPKSIHSAPSCLL